MREFDGKGFFTSRTQYSILETGIVDQIALFERRLRGAAQTPLARPYPFRTWPGLGTRAERDKRELRKLLYFGRYTPELFLDLGIYMQSLNEKNIWENMHLFPSWYHFQIGFLFRPHHTFFMVTPRRVWPIVVQRLRRCFSMFGFRG